MSVWDCNKTNQCALALGDDVSWIVDSFLLLHFKSCNPRNAPQEVLIWPMLSAASQCLFFLILSKNYMAFLPSKSIKLVVIASKYSTHHVTFWQLMCKNYTFLTKFVNSGHIVHVLQVVAGHYIRRPEKSFIIFFRN